MKKVVGFLVLLIVISLAFRLSVSLSKPSFSDAESYYVMRNIESIKETGMPLYHDKLSYSGRENVVAPGLLYILALFPQNIKVIQVLMSLLAILPIVIVFVIVLQFADPLSALMAASFAAWIPALVQETLNSITTISCVIFLILAAAHLYLNLKANEPNKALLYVITTLVLALISPLSIILVLGLLIYALACKVERIGISKTKNEALIFSAFCILWVEFLLYKKAILLHGPKVIWQNLPAEYLSNYFSSINIVIAIIGVGILPLVFGLYTIYRYGIKNEQMILYSGLTITIVGLLLLRLVKLPIGLCFLGVLLSVLSGRCSFHILKYARHTRVRLRENTFYLLVYVAILVTAIIPTIVDAGKLPIIDKGTVEALHWIKNNTQADAIILGSFQEGHLITYIANRRNVGDTSFLLIEDIDKRVEDMKTMYTSSVMVRAVELLNKYHVEYIILNDAKKAYGIDELPYSSTKCIKKVVEKPVIIYKVQCDISEKTL